MRVTLLTVTAAMFLSNSGFAQTVAVETSSVATSAGLTGETAETKKPELEKLTEVELTKLVFEKINARDTNKIKPLLNALMYYRHNEVGETILTQAILNNDPAMVRLLVRDAVINLKNQTGETPLTLALKQGNPEIIRMIARRAKAALKNDQDESPLLLAIQHSDDLFLLQELIDKGADVNQRSNGITPIAGATELGKVQTVALLLRNGANPSQTNANGDLPLFLAVRKGNDVMTGILLHKSKQADKDANWRTKIGEPLLTMAASQGNDQMVRILLEFGADPAAANFLENTALHIAAENGFAEMATLLLEKGAPVDKPNIMGTTPIMAAAQNKHDELANLLVENGANPDRRNFAGVAANDYGAYAVRTSIREEYEQMIEGQPKPSGN